MSGETKNYFCWKHLSSITKPIKKKFHRLSWAFYMYHRELRVCCTKAVSSLSDFLCFSCWCSFFYLFMFSQVSFPIFILPTKQRYVSKKILFCLQLGYTFEPLLPAPASHSVKQFWAKAGRQGQARQGLGNKNTSCWPDTMFRGHFTFHDLLLFEGLLLQLAHDDDLWCCDWQPLLRLIERCSQLMDARPLTPFSDGSRRKLRREVTNLSINVHWNQYYSLSLVQLCIAHCVHNNFTNNFWI